MAFVDRSSFMWEDPQYFPPQGEYVSKVYVESLPEIDAIPIWSLHNLLVELDASGQEDYANAIRRLIKWWHCNEDEKLPELIRCKDCKKNATGLCPMLFTEMKDKDFCSYGERREG